MKNIKVVSRTEEIVISNDPLSIYDNLKKRYKESDIFLLESMSGPAKDCNNSIIAFEPLLTVKVKEKMFSLEGDENIVSFICGHEELSSFFSESRSGSIKDINDIKSVLRKIESVFYIEKEGFNCETFFGFFGYFGYDTIFYIENLERHLECESNFSTIYLTIYRGVININIKDLQVTLTINDSDFFSGVQSSEIRKWVKSFSKVARKNVCVGSSIITPEISCDVYHEWFQKAKHHIGMGDVYQIQLGHEIHINSQLEPYHVYLRMREINPSPYMYFFKTTENVYVIGASPEMFVSLNKERKIFMRPIAGTTSNSICISKKEYNKKSLLSNEKERAEHLMLVDLCRNDISKVCKPCSLHVDDLMVTEEYSHVIHLVSQVSGELCNEYDKYDALTGAFPAGTMTGTPKIKAMEIIEDTENSSRGIYAGCVGFFGFNNIMISALCIRTAIYVAGEYIIRASGGIVEDSTYLGEWEETLNKLSSTYLAITGKELRDEIFGN